MSSVLAKPIHTSVRIESPTCALSRQAVPIFPPIFRVLSDEKPPEGGVVITLLYSSKRSQMLKAFWLHNNEQAERFIEHMPQPASILRHLERRECKSQVMPKQDWRFYREEWLDMNRAEPGPCD